MERINKEKRVKIMKIIKEAGDSDNYEVSWNEEGAPYKIKQKSKIRRGKVSRARGARFELSVRASLEKMGYVVDKWSNNVDLDKGEISQAKRKFNPFSKAMSIGTGFPDFIAIKLIHEGAYNVIGVEVKINGILSKIEKEKCAWYLKRGIFSSIWIASAIKHGRKGEIEYIDFKERYGSQYNKS